MIDYSFAKNKINELVVKYHTASAIEKKSIKYEIFELFSKIYQDQKYCIEGFTREDYISEMYILLYDSNKKSGACILDVFKEGDFVAYMNKALLNRFVNQNIRDKFIESCSDKMDMELPGYALDTNNRWKIHNPTKVRVKDAIKLESKTDNVSQNTSQDDKIHCKNNVHRTMKYSDIESDVADIQEANFFLLSVLQMEFLKHLTKKQNNPDRQMYTRLFYTEHITAFCKLPFNEYIDNYLRETLMDNETTIFQSINTDFLDHIMEELCRCIGEISESEYKKNKCFGIKQNPEDRISPVFDAKVYKSFLKDYLNKSVSDAAISQQRKYYYESIDKLRS